MRGIYKKNIDKFMKFVNLEILEVPEKKPEEDWTKKVLENGGIKNENMDDKSH